MAFIETSAGGGTFRHGESKARRAAGPGERAGDGPFSLFVPVAPTGRDIIVYTLLFPLSPAQTALSGAALATAAAALLGAAPPYLVDAATSAELKGLLARAAPQPARAVLQVRGVVGKNLYRIR